ncbi:hypothetical protein FQN49_008335 [Arthroderma sp. PD_2]|nr:hypothetical protein FQN49_008335 [Arthroderma sp. PD_2]
MDVPSLISWLSARQYSPEGGFSGRTNKLVDGCYSHWVGGCWPLIQEALDAPGKLSNGRSLYSREGLTRYILGCCQSQYGGLRDKPGKHADSHHTCYTLAGLSNAQHYHSCTCSKSGTTDPSAYSSSNDDDNSKPFSAAFSWTCSPIVASTDDPDTVYDEDDRVKPLHPLFVIPHSAAERIRSWCKANPITIPQEAV